MIKKPCPDKNTKNNFKKILLPFIFYFLDGSPTFSPKGKAFPRDES